jgi:hypothetical protein
MSRNQLSGEQEQLEMLNKVQKSNPEIQYMEDKNGITVHNLNGKKVSGGNGKKNK